MNQEVPIQEKRGFEFSGLYINPIGILLVKAPIEEVSPLASEIFGGKLDVNVIGKQFPFNLQLWRRIVFQYRGHSWTIILFLRPVENNTAKLISKILKTRCIYIAYEDKSGWLNYSLFDQGDCIEVYQWGTVSQKEVWESKSNNLLQLIPANEARKTWLGINCNPQQWDIYVVEDSSCYRFCSDEYAVTKEELLDSNKLLDTLLRNQDAWLPDWDYLPLPEVLTAEHPNANNFVRLDAIYFEIN